MSYYYLTALLKMLRSFWEELHYFFQFSNHLTIRRYCASDILL